MWPRKALLGGGVLLLLAGLNGPAVFSLAERTYHEYRTGRPGYRAAYGSWKVLDVPSGARLNAIHAALLHTGKVLLIAGSGNDEKKFERGTFESTLWDPARNTFTPVPTPGDFFGAGHAQLPDGRLLVAGGTARHDVRDDGAIRGKNESQDFRGTRAAYVFDPKAEKYVPVAPMREPRRNPTLVTLDDGRVLAVSGGSERSEIYDPGTGTWSPGPSRSFPGRPALFLTRGGELFHSGAGTGGGPGPGLWDLRTNTFRPVGGLTGRDRLESAASLLLPPAQDQKVMVLGGGAAGPARGATERTAVAAVGGASPLFRAGHALPRATRYLGAVLLPDDTVFTSGGSQDYRGRGTSDVREARFYDPGRNVFRAAADPAVGRNHHSGALLLPDGRVATFGSDPLFADAANTRFGSFERRVEVFTPPYLHRPGGKRPVLGDGPSLPDRAGRATFRTADAGRIVAARLLRPSAVTQTTDVEQRSVELAIDRAAGALTVRVPGDRTLVPPGWYMLFAVDREGTPSAAKWLQVR
ncbi:galactose oxidase early set domain-containing protein [Streptomyces sp. NPDC000410]|uniref:galactose oxidase early set domain-containing protein n=1 Tax=Streptomyces sp. NPDC000410 TaxID=3154254 RepID=UPI0033236623